jgi:hypothetical protein
MKTFVNFSNHPSSSWSEAQREAAEKYGRIVDIEFPQVPAEADESQVAMLARKELQAILSLDPAAVMVQGEFTLAFGVVSALISMGIKTVAACSERQTVEWKEDDGTAVKKAVFRFTRFREYIDCSVQSEVYAAEGECPRKPAEKRADYTGIEG